MMRARSPSIALRREAMAADRIPYGAHVAPRVIRTTFGDYLQAFRLGGADFETRDDEELNNWHERLNVLWRNIAAPGVSLWTHVVRGRARIGGARTSGGGFAGRLQDRYLQRICGETLRQNEIYLSVLYRPAGMAAGLVARALARVEREALRQELAEGLDACDKLSQTLTASLVRYEPEALGCYWNSKAWCSSLLEFLGLLINGEWQRMPLARSPLNAVLACTRVMFGGETIEYRSATETRVGAMLGIKEYPTPTAVGMYNELLSAPLSFVLTQSFTFLGKPASQSLLQRQFNRMANAGDFAVSQAAELKDALDALTSNDFVMGDHHFTLQVVAAIGEAGSAGAANRLKNLNDGVALARALLADTGMLVAREDLALEAAFWAQLPGNFPLRPRKSPITSRNFAAMAPFHNYPAGPCPRQSLGRRPGGPDHEFEVALLFLAARQRSWRSGWGKPQGHGPHSDLRTHGIGQDRIHRISGLARWSGRTPRRSSSTRIAGSRSWCVRWAATTLL